MCRAGRACGTVVGGDDREGALHEETRNIMHASLFRLFSLESRPRLQPSVQVNSESSVSFRGNLDAMARNLGAIIPFLLHLHPFACVLLEHPDIFYSCFTKVEERTDVKQFYGRVTPCPPLGRRGTVPGPTPGGRCAFERPTTFSHPCKAHERHLRWG